MRERNSAPIRPSPHPARRTSVGGSWRCTQRAAALLAALATAACSTPDYTYARETRSERPYRGGAAAVPDEKPENPNAKGPEPLDVFALFGVIALMFSRPESYSPGRSQPQFGPPAPPPPPQSK